jgi:uncharacterized membrane protein (DUF2068 family)
LNKASKRQFTQRHTLHAIAIYEGVKGVVALAASIGLVGLLHHDLRRIASELIGHFGLDPERPFPALLLHYVDLLNSTNIRSLVLLALAYAVLRLAEAYGLWRDRPWGGWLGAASGGLYLPFEIYHLSHRLTWTGALVFVANLSMVAFLVTRMWRRRSEPVPVVSGSA